MRESLEWYPETCKFSNRKCWGRFACHCTPPNMLQAIPAWTPTPPNFGGAGPVGPTATPVQNTVGAPGDYFQPGPLSLSYLPNF